MRKHIIFVLILFCFMTDVPGVYSYDVKQHLMTSMTKKQEPVTAPEASVMKKQEPLPAAENSDKQTGQTQDFFKATVQAYKDFNEQTVKYLALAFSFLSVVAAGLVGGFIYLFRRTLAEIKRDITEDSDRVKDVYSKTFEILNKQAEINQMFFEKRDREIGDTLKKMQDIASELEKNDMYREGLATVLAKDKISKDEEQKSKTRNRSQELLESLKKTRIE